MFLMKHIFFLEVFSIYKFRLYSCYLKCFNMLRLSLLPPSHTNKHTHFLMHAHTLAWWMHCAIWELCVMGSQQGDGSMCCCCSLSIRLSVYSHILSSTDSSSLLLRHCMRESPSNLGIREAVINLIHLNTTHGGFFTSSFTCRTASVSLILFASLLQTETQRYPEEEKGLHSLDKVK